MEKSIYTKEEQEFLNNYEYLSEEEKKEFFRRQTLLNEQNGADFKEFDMTDEEFCQTYGYVNLNDFLTNNGIVSN